MEREWPTGYLAACKTHPDFDKDSVEAIWDQLNFWRKNKSVLLAIFERAEHEGHTGIAEKVQWQLKSIADFEDRVLKAALEDDKPFLRNLRKAVNASRRPSSVTDGIRAAIEAFWELFVEQGFVSHDDWPTKQEVRLRAEEILKQNRLLSPGDRQWPRIYQRAGLKDLLSVKHGPAHKQKSRSGTKSART